MIDVVPVSHSLILRATHVLVVEITASSPGPWLPPDAPAPLRTVHLDLRLTEVVKGDVQQRAGDAVKVDVKQVDPAMTLGQVPGLWSSVPIDPGTKLVVFASTDSHDAGVIANEPAGLRLVPTEAALADVHTAAQVSAAKLDLSGAVAQARPVAGTLTDLFSDYLWEQYSPSAMADPQKFDVAAGFLEEPTLHLLARTALLMAMTTAVDAPEPPPLKQMDRLAVALFHLLAMREAAPQHDNLMSTYLPNLLSVDEPHARPPSEVFADYPAEKAKALAAVSAYHGTESTAPLLAWLRH